MVEMVAIAYYTTGIVCNTLVIVASVCVVRREIHHSKRSNREK